MSRPADDGNYDADNREAPPKNHQGKAGGDVNSGIGVAEPWWPVEDDIDEQVRHDLDRWERAGDVRFIGRDGPRRFPATRQEALAALPTSWTAAWQRSAPTRTPCCPAIRGWRTPCCPARSTSGCSIRWNWCDG
jgi:hypothetical protein